MGLKVSGPSFPGSLAVFADYALDLVRVVADEAVNLDRFDYAGLPPLNERLYGDTEEFGGFFLGEEIGLEVQLRTPIFFRNFSSLWRVRS